MATHPDGHDYYQECHYESMIYSRAYQARIYNRDQVTDNHNSIIVSRVIRKAKRILRKKSKKRTKANLKVESTPCNGEHLIANSMSIIECASMQEAVDYEI